jgi:hypothetical protein
VRQGHFPPPAPLRGSRSLGRPRSIAPELRVQLTSAAFGIGQDAIAGCTAQHDGSGVRLVIEVPPQVTRAGLGRNARARLMREQGSQAAAEKLLMRYLERYPPSNNAADARRLLRKPPEPTACPAAPWACGRGTPRPPAPLRGSRSLGRPRWHVSIAPELHVQLTCTAFGIGQDAIAG